MQNSNASGWEITSGWEQLASVKFIQIRCQGIDGQIGLLIFQTKIGCVTKKILF